MTSSTIPHGRRAIRNMLTLAGGHVGSTLVLLAMTPYFFGTLGASKYGLLTLFFALIQYVAIVDFGLGPGLVKYIAEDHTNARPAGIRQMMTFALIFYVVMGVVVISLVALFGRHVVLLIKMPDDLRPEAFPLLLGFALYFFVAAIGFTLHSVLSGVGRLDLSAAIRAGSLIFYVLATFVALCLGLGLNGMLGASFLTLAVSIPITYVVAHREFGPIYCSPVLIRWNSVRRVFVTGGWIQLSSIMTLIYSQTNGIVIGFVVNVAAVAIYDLASRLSRAIRAFAYYANAALLPAMSSLEARKGTVAIHQALIDGSRYVAALSFCGCGFVIAGAPVIFSAWLGARVEQRGLMSEVLIVLCLTAVIDNYIGVATTVLRAIGAPKLEVVYSVTTAVINIAITVALAPRYGVIGVVIGTLVGSLVGSVLFMIMFSRIRRLPMLENFVRPLVKICIVTVVASAATALIVRGLTQNGMPARPVALAEVVALGLCYALIFVVMLGTTGYLYSGDLAFIKRILPSRLPVAVDRRLIRFLFVGSR